MYNIISIILPSSLSGIYVWYAEVLFINLSSKVCSPCTDFRDIGQDHRHSHQQGKQFWRVGCASYLLARSPGKRGPNRS